MSKFWLVQRLKLRTHPEPNLGFDGFFLFDYMGSSEFEWGAPNKALKSMRGRHLDLFPFALNGKTLYVIGERGDVGARIDDMLDWLTHPEHRRRTLERTYFPEHLYDKADDYMLDVVAWWSFDDDLAWTLDRTIADTLLTAFQTRKTA